MLFNPNTLIKKEGAFLLPTDAVATAHFSVNKDIVKEFWRNFSLQTSDLSIVESDALIFCIGDVSAPSLDGNAYCVRITQSGACVCAENEQSLMHGFMALIDRFCAVDIDGETRIELECCELWDRPLITNRMVHFCIFPETELWELQRFIRFCGALRYTHIVLEFWGMLKYDCMKELSWSNGFTKEQIAPIVREARDLGLEVIPMFNHWGHASAGRVVHGKHVVLDQNPALQTYFSEDGWCWDIGKVKVRELLRRIRAELIELCGEGEYFHIGCDEAYNFELTDENINILCSFINGVSDEMKSQGRRVIMWGDMILYHHQQYNPKNRYTCNAPSPEVEKSFLERLSKDVVIADWQYHVTEAPVETVSVFKNAGFDCLLCPWDDGAPAADATIATLQGSGLMGFMHTTWHTLSAGMPFVTFMALGGFEAEIKCDKVQMRTYTAALMRKVMPACGDYSRAGWSKIQVSFKW